MARYLTDGRLDRAFGGDGRVTTDVSPSGEQFTDVARAARRADRRGGVGGGVAGAGVRRGAIHDGRPARPDVRRRRHRRASTSPPGADRARAIARQRATGSSCSPAASSASGRDEWGLIRLGPRGHLDPTFADHGRLVTDFGPGFDEAQGVAVQANGKLLVAGRIREGTKDDIGVLRLKPGGGHDRTFGAGGRALTDVAGGSDAARDLTIASNGKIVVAGEATVDRIRRFVVVRYLASDLDSSADVRSAD